MYTHISFMPAGAALLAVDAASLVPAAHTIIAMPAIATETAFAIFRGKDLNMGERSSIRVCGYGKDSMSGYVAGRQGRHIRPHLNSKADGETGM
jgi:hypothetical protein